MHGLLRKRDLDTVLVEDFFYLLIKKGFDCSVVLAFHPGSHDEVDTRVGQLGERYCWRRVVENSAVVFDNVTFGYREGDAVLRGINLSVKRGENVAVVGATGSGKSTIIRLLARLYEPQEGRILLAGRDIRTIDSTALRRRLTVAFDRRPAGELVACNEIEDRLL